MKNLFLTISGRLFFIPMLCCMSLYSAVEATEIPSVSAQSRMTETGTDRLIIKYRNTSRMTINQLSAGAMLNNAGRTLGISMNYMRNMKNGAQVWRLDGRKSISTLHSLVTAIANNPNVEYVEPDLIMQPMFTPNDSRYNEQWHYFETTGGLNLPTAWDNATGTGAVVAVIDTGYRPHADLAANILPGYDMIIDSFVSNDGDGRDADASDPGDAVAASECGAGAPARNSSWHGTHVAGTVAAVTNNGTGVAGIAFDAKVVPVRVLGKCGGYTSDIADGILWASGATVSGVPTNANPAQVINMSLGGGGACGVTMQNAIDQARNLGTTLVVAAGNSNIDAINSSPANCSGVVTVAATNRSGGHAFYSNFGTIVDIAAPGGDTRGGAANGILSTLNTGSTTPGGDSYAFYQGTSMATPHVAGLAALLYSADSTITPDEVEANMKATARAFPATCNGCGAGIADAASAVDAVLSGGTTPPPAADSVLENGVAKTGLVGAQGEELHFTMNVPSGATNLQFNMSGGVGDADLYIRFGAAPTTAVFNYRPYLNGNNETVNVATAQEGTYYVMLHGYFAFSGVSLVGSFSEPTAGGGSFFENKNNVPIVDFVPVQSSIAVTRTGASGIIGVHVDIKHTYIVIC